MDFKRGGNRFGGGPKRDFSRPTRPSFGGDRGGFNKFGGGNRGAFGGPQEMHTAICDKCGKECQVPFRPNGKKPVYCNDCFGKTGGESRGSSFGAPQGRATPPQREFRSEPRSESRTDTHSIDTHTIDMLKKQLEGINTKLNTLIDGLKGNGASASAAEPSDASAAPKKEKKAKVSKKK